MAFDNSATYADAENQFAELILRDRQPRERYYLAGGQRKRRHGQPFGLYVRPGEKAKELDGSRLVSAACLINHVELKIEDRLAEALDVIGINEYYGWYDPDFGNLPKIFVNSAPGKPVAICEFGGDARKSLFKLWIFAVYCPQKSRFSGSFGACKVEFWRLQRQNSRF